MDRDFGRLARHFLLRVVPQAAAQLRRLKMRAMRIPDEALRREALASIAQKDFHVHGGCILATFLPPARARAYVSLVAVFETAVDYLDNLCDRTGSVDENDFRALHEALIDAVSPGTPLRSYFRHRPSDDGGYLSELVQRAQEHFASLPSLDAVLEPIRVVTQRYCELQALKHLPPGVRERRCEQAFGSIASDLRWWEGAAACGSTLPTFALAYGAMHDCSPTRARDLFHTYFPTISAFHILLDYFIDQAEDETHGELNFVACYPSRAAARDGIARIGARALEQTQGLDDASHHAFAVRAMCAFYCSRAKIAQQRLGEDAEVIAAGVGVELEGSAWNDGQGGLLAPLLALYRRAISV